MMNLSHTAQSGLTLHNIEGYNGSHGIGKWVKFWQHKDADMRQVGPCYPTKAEALADTKGIQAAAQRRILKVVFSRMNAQIVLDMCLPV